MSEEATEDPHYEEVVEEDDKEYNMMEQLSRSTGNINEDHGIELKNQDLLF